MLGSMAYPAGARFVALLLPAWAVGVCALFGLVDVRVCAVLVLVVICLVVPLSTRVRTARVDGSPAMMLVTLRDMQWRARRIVIGLAATSLVLAIAALLGALHDGFLDETDRTIAFFGGDTWVVPAGVSGPFTSNSPMPQAWADGLRGEAGPQTVTPVAIFRHAIQGRGAGSPTSTSSPTPRTASSCPASSRVAQPLHWGRRPSTSSWGRMSDMSSPSRDGSCVVVGEVRGLTYNGGTPTVLITLGDGQTDRVRRPRRWPARSSCGARPGRCPPSLATMSPERGSRRPAPSAGGRDDRDRSRRGNALAGDRRDRRHARLPLRPRPAS